MNQSVPLVYIQCMAYHPAEEQIAYCRRVADSLPGTPLYISTPHSYLRPFQQALTDPLFFIGANEMLPADPHTFTGDITATTLKTELAKFVLIGSAAERVACEKYHHCLSAKCVAAIDGEVLPFICLSETWRENEEGHSKEKLAHQLKSVIEGIPLEKLDNLHILYHAPWINDSLYDLTDEILTTSYKTFQEAVKEVIGHQTNVRMIAAVPNNLETLGTALEQISSAPFEFSGVSLGFIQAHATIGHGPEN